MTINEAKKSIKEKGYSIRTIYDPRSEYITIQILEHENIICCYYAISEKDCEERVIYIEKFLKILSKLSKTPKGS